MAIHHGFGLVVLAISLAACSSSSDGGDAGAATGTGGAGGATSGTGGAGGTTSSTGGAAGSSGGGGGADSAWSGGPPGHLYVFTKQLWDIDTADGTITRSIQASPGSGLAATSAGAFFLKTDGSGSVVSTVGPTGTTVTPTTAKSFTMTGVVGGKVVGTANSDRVVVFDPATQSEVVTMLPTTMPVLCDGRSVSDKKLYLICMKISAGGQEVGMMDFDVGATTFGPYVSVAPAMATDSPLASNLTYTSAGLLLSYLTGGPTSGTREVFHIDPTSYAVSPGVMVAGMSNNLDEQDAVGTTVWMTQGPSNQVLPFDVATMTAGTAVSVSHPQQLRTGGGQVFVGMHGMATEPTGDGAVAKIDPATGNVAYRTFPKPGSDVQALAFTGP